MSQYPTFEEKQQGFAVQHNNPFPQPVNGQTYQPPAQYGGSQPIAVVVPQQGQQTDLTNQITVKEIDQLLSRGHYCFYKYWLYVMIIFGGYGLVNNLYNKSENYPMALEGLVAVLYSICMLETLKDKSLNKARIGVFLSFLSLILLVIALYSQFLHVDFFGSGDDARTIVYVSLPSVMYMLFVVIMPALRIKGHLERREILLQKGSEVGDV